MKLKVLIGTLVWTVFITFAHVQLNVGWARATNVVKGLFTDVQKEMQVGFLPVT